MGQGLATLARFIASAFPLAAVEPADYSPRLVISGLPPLRDRLQHLRDRIAAAATRAGRTPDAVRLVAVVKTVPVEAVDEAVALGIGDLGESRVQEAQARIAHVGRQAARWHLVGHLQRNKAGHAVELFDRIHGVDGMGLAEA